MIHIANIRDPIVGAGGADDQRRETVTIEAHPGPTGLARFPSADRDACDLRNQFQPRGGRAS